MGYVNFLEGSAPRTFSGRCQKSLAPWAGQANAKKDFWRLRRFLRNRQVQIWMAGYKWMGMMDMMGLGTVFFLGGLGGLVSVFLFLSSSNHTLLLFFFWSWTKQQKSGCWNRHEDRLFFFLRHQHYIHKPMRIWWCHVALRKKMSLFFWYSTRIAFERQLRKLECGNFHLKRVASLHGKSSANIIHLYNVLGRTHPKNLT